MDETRPGLLVPLRFSTRSPGQRDKCQGGQGSMLPKVKDTAMTRFQMYLSTQKGRGEGGDSTTAKRATRFLQITSVHLER